MRRISELGKVVIQTRERELFRGFSKADFIAGSTIKVIDEKGKQFELPLENLKAVFFVRDFNGNPKYNEVRFLSTQGKSVRWVVAEIRFQDDEVVEGKIRNDLEFLTGRGFFLFPSDEIGNTEVIYVVKTAIKGFRVVGLK